MRTRIAARRLECRLAEMRDCRPIVYLAPHRWDDMRARAQQLSHALSAHRPVLYVEPVVAALGNLRLALLGRPTRPWHPRLVRKAERLWVFSPPPLLPLTPAWAPANPLGHRPARPSLRRAARRLGPRRPVGVVAWPPAAAWGGERGESRLVYDCMDDFPAFDLPRHRRRLLASCEESLI